MTDVHDPETRSRNMAAIRGRDTKPERLLRSVLHRAGYRFRLKSGLPGKPDLVLPKYQAAIFVHGCFWHMHDCPRFKYPGGANAGFWQMKLERNAQRDIEVSELLHASGWRQFVVWECTLVGKGRLDLGVIVEKMGAWLASGAETGEIAGVFG